MIDLPPERQAAAALEARILAAWQDLRGSRHISEIAAAMCGSAWTFELKPLMGGAYDIEVRPRHGRDALPPAELSEVAVLEPEAESEPPRIVVALSWPWPDRQPADLPERVRAWRAEILARGGLP
jgi:hypothetical protein